MKKTKILLSSILTIMLCVSLITGATFALFTSEDHVNIAITSGKVEVEARVGKVAYASDTTDTYTEWTDAVDVDGVLTGTFANKGTVGYDSAENELTLNNITPGDAVKFTVDIYNRSTVAAKYSVRIGASEDTDDIFKYFKVTKCGKEGESEDEVLTGSPIVVSEWAALDVPTAEEAVDSIELIIALPSAVTSEQAEDKSCTVALTVVAVQANGQTCADTGIHNYVDDVCTWCGAANPYASLAHDESGENYIINEAPATEDGHLVIPGMINGKHVVLGENAFQGRDDIIDVTMGEGITQVTSSAFEGCENLTEVTFPSSVTEIGAHSFKDCGNLKTVNWPQNGSFEIEGGAFLGTGLESVILPEGCTAINCETFGECESLTTVHIPSTITTWDEDVFWSSPNISDVTLEEGLTMIGPLSFNGKPNLTHIEIPSTVKTIGYSAFYNSGLQGRLVLPEGLESIGYSAFYKNAGLTEVVIPSTVTTMGDIEEAEGNCFGECTKLSKVTIGVSGKESMLQPVYRYMFENCTSLKNIEFYGTWESFQTIFYKQEWPAKVSGRYGVNVKVHYMQDGEEMTESHTHYRYD